MSEESTNPQEPTDAQLREVLGSGEIPEGARPANPEAVVAPETQPLPDAPRPVASVRTVEEPDEMIDLQKEARLEFRVVCASHGTPGHHEHTYVKRSLKLCHSYAAKLDQRTKGDQMRAMEVPFQVQVRIVSDWEDAPE